MSTTRLVALTLLLFGAVARADDEDDAERCAGYFALSEGGSLSAAHVRFASTGTGLGAGAAVAVGDFDGDGVDDLAIGAPGDDVLGRDDGAVYLFFGPLGPSAPSLSTADARITGTGAGGGFGTALAALGDVDGDGRDDLLVGAPGAPSALERRGYAVVVYGSRAFPVSTAWSTVGHRILGESQDELFGASVAALGDVDGDGLIDFAIGAPGSDEDGNNAGRVSVFLDWRRALGSAQTPALRITGSLTNAALGTAISGIGDFNGDGFADFAVGAPGDSRYVNRAGAVGVFYGAGWLPDRYVLDDAPVRLHGDHLAAAGSSLVAAGDVTGDGRADLWVGAPGSRPNNRTDAGSAFLVEGTARPLGSLALSFAASARVDGSQGARVGAALAAGDVNGDGRPDVAVGAPGYRGADRASGGVWVLEAPFASVTSVVAGDVFAGAGAEDAAGSALALADFNGDGLLDLVVGAPDKRVTDAGRVSVTFGGREAAYAQRWYTDADRDGYGVGTGVLSCSTLAGRTLVAGDCADADARRHPGASESACDGVDWNCDGVSSTSVDSDGDGFLACRDCDDTNPARFPTATERCNALDDDCNGIVDDSSTDGPVWFLDADGDGFGAPATAVHACVAPVGQWILTSGDCADDDREIGPTRVELCDGVDNDCDGQADEGATGAVRWYADRDRDGWGDWANFQWSCARPANHVATFGDCDDSRPGVNPDAREVCNYRDDDCDGQQYMGGPRNTDSARLGVGGAGGNFGQKVAFIPDWNGDGRDEVAVAAPGEGQAEGAVYIRHADKHGGFESLTTPRQDGSYGWSARISGAARTEFARSIGVGDFDGDGVADLAVGSGRLGNGTIFVFYGPVTGDLRAMHGVALRGDSGWNVGEALAVGDVTGDGAADLIVGAPGARHPARGRTGAVVVVPGGARWTSGHLRAAGVVGFGERGDALGTHVSFVGDITGDGVGDFGSASPRANDFFGLAWVYPGGPMSRGFPASIARIQGSMPAEHPGKSMAGLDFNGDGIRDLALGTDAVRAWVILGGRPLPSGALDTTRAIGLLAPIGHDFGEEVANLGDADGDGDDELVISAPEADLPNATDVGGVWVIQGGQDLARHRDAAGWIPVIKAESYGRITRPEDPDPIASAQNYLSYEGGRVSGRERGMQLGVGLATGGDFDGDGVSDLLLGAPRATWAGAARAGSAWVFLAGPYGHDVRADDPVLHHWDRDLDAWADPVEDITVCPMHVWWEITRPQPYALAEVSRWTDCNDDDDAIHPGATEVIGDGVDQNCAAETEVCNGHDDDDDFVIDEGFSDVDDDGVADCVDFESCDGRDNDGDFAVDENFPDTDRDTIADCMDVEECDGLDNDGDGAIDEGFGDVDGDGLVDCLDIEDCDHVDNDGDGDIDEGFPANCPGEDPCNGVDDDNNGTVDDGYADADADGVADCVDVETCDGVDNDGDGHVDDGFSDIDGDGTADCMDTETCDGLDEDGNGVVDDGFPDTDGDGTADCVDTEACDGLDNDGDGSTDEGFDDDGDGYANCFETCNVTTSICSDPKWDRLSTGAPAKAAWVHPAWSKDIPAGTWIWRTRLVRDASTRERTDFARDLYLPTDMTSFTAVMRMLADNTIRGSLDGEVFWDDPSERNYAGVDRVVLTDRLREGGKFLLEFSVENIPLEGSSATWNPAALNYCLDVQFTRDVDPEVCNGVDDDCDGRIDEGLRDTDRDGLCDAVDPELCNDLDDDGDGLVDEDINRAPTWFFDGDRDGYGGDGYTACGVPDDPRYVERGGDCADTAPGIHPGADEICDGVDQDCDGVIDENPVDGTRYYVDGDADGHGAPGAWVVACVVPPGYDDDNDDCDDANPYRSPSAPEVANAIDDDCDGEADDAAVALVAAWQCYEQHNATWNQEMLAIETWLAERRFTSLRLLPDTSTRALRAGVELTEYQLVIYTKCGEPWAAYNQRDVDQLQRARAAGASVLLFDDDLTLRTDRVGNPNGLLLFAPGAPEIPVDDSDGPGTGISEPVRTDWQRHEGMGVTADNPYDIVTPLSGCPNNTPPRHGDDCEYASAVVPPAVHTGWGPAPDPTRIGFAGPSKLNDCRVSADFSYYQTFVTVPAGYRVNTFTIYFDGMDDGSRVTIYNSAWPAGLVIPGSYVYTYGSGTADLAPYVRAGETNRVVVTQVDDCAVWNQIQVAEVVLNGQYIRQQVCGANGDSDDDSVCDDLDNCDFTVNPDQGDRDADSLGDACDVCPADADISGGCGYDGPPGRTISFTAAAASHPSTHRLAGTTLVWPWAMDIAEPADVGETVLATADGYPVAAAKTGVNDNFRQISMLFGGRYTNPGTGLPGNLSAPYNVFMHDALSWLLRLTHGPEVCGNHLDDDRDGQIDEGDAADAVTLYVDADGDGWGDDATVQACPAATGTSSLPGDCDDARAATFPGADERCDDTDNDCDSVIDEDAVDAPLFFRDADGDGFGDPAVPTAACDLPSGHVDDDTDCDDTRRRVNPAGTEICNSRDDDCDGAVDEDATDRTRLYADADGDGSGAGSAVWTCPGDGFSPTSDDCAPLDANRGPLRPDVIGDGVDNDCDGRTDEADVLAVYLGQCSWTYDNARVEAETISTFLGELGLRQTTYLSTSSAPLPDLDMEQYSLVVFSKCGWMWGSYNQSDVTQLNAARAAGASTFLFEDDGAFGMWNVTGAEQITLFASGNDNGGGPSPFRIVAPNHPVIDGPFGVATNFTYPYDIDRCPAVSDATVVAMHRDAGTPAFVVRDTPGGSRQATLLVSVFQANHGSVGEGVQSAATMFKNTVHWLLRFDE